MATAWASVAATIGLEVDQKKTAKTIEDAVGKAKAEAELKVDKTKTRKTVEDAVKGAKPEADVKVDERGVSKSVEDAVGSAKAEADVGVDDKSLAGAVEDAISGATPETDVAVNTDQVAGDIEDAASGSTPTADVDVDTGSVAGQIEDAASAAAPATDVDVDTAGVAGQIEDAASQASPTADVDIDASQVAAAIETAAEDAHPVVPVEVELDADALADSIQSAVEDAMASAPPITIPVDHVETSRQVESGLRGADTGSAGKEAGGKFAAGFGGPMNVLKASVAGAVGAEAIMGSQQLFGSMIAQAGAANKSMKVLDEAIKTTGGSAGVTSKDIDAMAAAQGRATGVSSTAIKQADALLLRFTNIRNEAGANNDVFNRTSQAALDLTAAMNKGVVDGDKLQGTMKLLGKAMEDPTKAAGTLRRYGISLTQQQQEQIKVFAKSGDTMSAQKVVLDAIGSSYGGTAEKTASAGAKIGETTRQMTESIGKALVPILTDLLKVVSVILKVLQPFIDALSASGKAAGILRYAVIGMVGAFVAYQGVLKATNALTTVTTALQRAQSLGLLGYLKQMQIVTAFTKLWAAATAALNAVLALNPAILITVGIIALAAAIYLLWTRSETFRKVVIATWDFIRKVVLAAIKALIGQFGGLRGALTGVTQVWQAMWQVLQQVATAALQAIAAVIRFYIDAWTAIFRIGLEVIKTIWNVGWEVMVAVLKTVGEYILLVLRTVIDTIKGVLQIGMALIRGDWEGAWNALKDTVHNVLGNVGEFIQGITGAWGHAFTAAGEAIAAGWSATWGIIHDVAVGAWQAIYDNAIGPLVSTFQSLPELMNTVAQGFIAGWDRVVGFFVDVAERIVQAWNALPQAFQRVGEGLHAAIKWIVNVPIAGLVKVFNSVGGPIHLPNIPVPHMAARGWRVNQGTSETADDVLVRVSRNETILSARTSRDHAGELRSWGVPGYASGGVPLPGMAFGGLAGRIASSIVGRVADAARAATSAVAGVVNGVVQIAAKAIDVGQIAADLAVEKSASLWQGMADIVGVVTSAGSELGSSGSWARQVGGAITKGLTDAAGKTLGGIAGKAASVLNIFGAGGIIGEPVAGVGLRSGQSYIFGENGPEMVTPFAAGGGGNTGSAGGITVTIPGITELTAALNRVDFNAFAASLGTFRGATDHFLSQLRDVLTTGFQAGGLGEVFNQGSAFVAGFDKAWREGLDRGFKWVEYFFNAWDQQLREGFAWVDRLLKTFQEGWHLGDNIIVGQHGWLDRLKEEWQAIRGLLDGWLARLDETMRRNVEALNAAARTAASAPAAQAAGLHWFGGAAGGDGAAAFGAAAVRGVLGAPGQTINATPGGGLSYADLQPLIFGINQLLAVASQSSEQAGAFSGQLYDYITRTFDQLLLNLDQLVTVANQSGERLGKQLDLIEQVYFGTDQLVTMASQALGWQGKQLDLVEQLYFGNDQMVTLLNVLYKTINKNVGSPGPATGTFAAPGHWMRGGGGGAVTFGALAAAGGYAAAGPLGFGGMVTGGAGGTMPSKADIQAWLASQDRLADQLARIGGYLQANPQQVANAVAQALNGVARLATAGASWATR